MLELLVVIAVMAIIATVLVMKPPASIAGLREQYAASVLASDLRHARVLAIAQHREVAVVPMASGRGYLVDGMARILPASMWLDARNEFDFVPQGGADSAIWHLVGRGRSFTLAVDGLTGEVMFHAAP